MKVLLYFESQKAIKKSGIGRAMRHQTEALKLANVPFTLNKDDAFDIAHINTLFFKSKRLLKKCHKLHIPAIVHGHSTLEDFRQSFRCWKLVKFWFNHQLLYMYKHADSIITPTNYSKHLIDNYQLGTPVKAISNGIDVEAYARDENKIKAFKDYFHITDEKVVIGIGLPFIRKGIDDFFEIARAFPDVTFIWFGHLAKILTQGKVLRAIKRRPSNVIMPGYIANDIIKGAMQYASALLFPSREETEGIVVLEALASHLCCLVRRIPVYDGWLKEGENCYMASDVDEFIEKLNLLLCSDNTQFTNKGYEVVKTKTLDKIGQELKETYEYVYSSFKKKD